MKPKIPPPPPMCYPSCNYKDRVARTIGRYIVAGFILAGLLAGVMMR